MKKIILLVLVLMLMMTLCACIRPHYDENNISILYNREWIIGQSREKIERRYGEFDREYVTDSGDIVGAYYVNYENYGMDPSYIHDTYFVKFNEEDIAIDAYFRETSKGG